ncbi:hypothetical protein BXZ70DRAFT_918692 [Cristinia sonorae]|uniref:Uncharacterized protein n=1 Tax=Cristinia sonorae TaxID=1940300 RepID=A0A8K0UYL5_9AGAR|nr:hypothetical protein BXZ70DRAFT_918692 [Cristinia sonorae]
MRSGFIQTRKRPFRVFLHSLLIHARPSPSTNIPETIQRMRLARGNAAHPALWCMSHISFIRLVVNARASPPWNSELGQINPPNMILRFRNEPMCCTYLNSCPLRNYIQSGWKHGRFRLVASLSWSQFHNSALAVFTPVDMASLVLVCPTFAMCYTPQSKSRFVHGIHKKVERRCCTTGQHMKRAAMRL